LLRESDESHEELREEKIEYFNKIAALENLSNECKKLAEANEKEQGNFTNSVKLIYLLQNWIDQDFRGYLLVNFKLMVG